MLYRPFLLARLDGRELPARRALRGPPRAADRARVLARADGRGGRALAAGRADASGIVTYYGFGQIYSTDTFTGGLVQAWTLCVEVTFYAFLPLWAWAMRRLGGRPSLRREACALLGLAAFSLAWKAAFVWSGPPDQVVLSPWLHSLPAYFDHFALGMGLAVLVAWRPLPRWVPLAGVVVARGRVLGREPADRDRLRALRAVHALAVHGPPPALRRGRVRAGRRRAGRGPGAGGRGPRARQPPVVFLGTISYGIYLWHVTVIVALERADV